MTRKIVERIVKGITDKIEANTADMDDWAEFWGFTIDEYEDFLDRAIKVLEQEPKTGHWIDITNKNGTVIAIRCDNCKGSPKHAIRSDFCPNCGAKMENEG